MSIYSKKAKQWGSGDHMTRANEEKGNMWVFQRNTWKRVLSVKAYEKCVDGLKLKAD